MEETRYYKIADHIISVTGTLSPIMERIGGFDVFETNKSLTTVLNVYFQQTKPEEFQGTCFYTMETDQLSIQFMHRRYGYGILMKDKVSTVSLLSIRYETENNTCLIKGYSNESILRLALWLVFGWSVIDKKTIAVHASTVVYQNKAILFLGESGVGKSTHTQLWINNLPGAFLLNDDSPILKIANNRVSAFGSPWSGKTPCFRQMDKEVAAIIRLSQHSENVINKLSIHESIAALYPSFPPCIGANSFFEKFVYDFLSDVLSQLPIYKLKCLPNNQAALLAYHTVFGQ